MRDDPVDRMMAEFGMAYKRRRRRRRERLGGHYWRLPWWSLSLLIHVVAMVLMWRTPYVDVPIEEYVPPLAIKLLPATRKPKTERPKPERPKTPAPRPVDPDPIDPDPPPEEPGPERPPDTTTQHSTKPDPVAPSTPSSTQVLAVQMQERGYRRSIYARRTSAGRTRMVGYRWGTTPEAERAVDMGLLWLVRAQEGDGHWSCRRWGGRDDYDVGMTGLALLALLGAGHTHKKGDFKDHIARGLAWLKSHQDSDGRFTWKTFYEQGIAAMAACEAFGLTRDLRVQPMAQQALNYICRVQPDHGGFRYQGAVTRGGGDLSVTGWQLLAFRSGICAELDVPDEALERARTFLDATTRDDGGHVYIVGSNATLPAMTAVGMLARQFVGGDKKRVDAAAEYLVSHERKVRGPGGGKNRLVGDLYYTYYSVLGMYQYGGDAWLLWNRLFRDSLLRRQVRALRDREGRFVRGSFDPNNHFWGPAGGRVYTTAMAVMSLEVYYRYLPMYRRKRPAAGAGGRASRHRRPSQSSLFVSASVYIASIYERPQNRF